MTSSDTGASGGTIDTDPIGPADSDTLTWPTTSRPATSVAVVLKADVAGREVVGQVNVSESAGPIGSVTIVPPDAPVSEEVIAALVEADQIVIGPGSLFTSVLAVCVVPTIREVLASATRARRIYVCNLRPQQPETAGFESEDHVRAVLDHGITPDTVVVDTASTPGAATGSILGIPLLSADLARSDGTGHDPDRLAAVLRLLT